MSESKTVIIQFKVNEDVRQKLRVQSALDGKTLSEYVRYAVQYYLDTHDVEVNLSEGLDSWGGGGRKNKDE